MEDGLVIALLKGVDYYLKTKLEKDRSDNKEAFVKEDMLLTTEAYEQFGEQFELVSYG